MNSFITNDYNGKYAEIINKYHEAYKREIVPVFKKERKKVRQDNFLFDCLKKILLKIDEMISSYCRIESYNKTLNIDLKKQIMPIICSCFDDLRWLDNVRVKSDYYKTGLVDFYSKNFDDDIFVGIHNRVNFEIVETQLYINDDKRVFKGVIIGMRQINKNFTKNTVIRTNSLCHKIKNPKLKRTILEDVVFEDKFDVFTNDEVEARYLITPSFMERLNNVKLAFKADSISCAFYKHNVYFALETNEDLFSIKYEDIISKGQEQCKKIFMEILSIIYFIDYFKMNEEISI